MSIKGIPENIISKIRKCLALTSSNWEGEARNAMAAAQKLMEQYGLSQAEIEMTADRTHLKDESIMESTVDSSHGLYAWEKLLGVVVQYLLPVKALLRRRQLVFIGAASDSQMAASFYRILFMEVERLSLSEQTAVERRAFMFGCVQTLTRRARDIEIERERAAEKSEAANVVDESRALVVVKKNDVTAYVKKVYSPRRESVRGPSSEHAEATSRGRAAGHNVNLNPNRRFLESK